MIYIVFQPKSQGGLKITVEHWILYTKVECNNSPFIEKVYGTLHSMTVVSTIDNPKEEKKILCLLKSMLLSFCFPLLLLKKKMPPNKQKCF